MKIMRAFLIATASTFFAFPVLAQQGNGSMESNTLGNLNQVRTGSGERTQKQDLDSQLVSDNEKMQNYKFGDFIVNSEVSLSEYYDDNIFYTRETPDEDFITVISPSLSLRSDWDKKALNIQSGATIGRYRQHNNENYEDYFAGFNGHIDLSNTSRIFGGAQYNYLHEGRESADAVSGVKPTEYSLLDAFAGGQSKFNDLTVKLGLTLQNYDYDDVSSSTGTINNDDRDRQEYEVGIRATRPWTEKIKLFVQGIIGYRNYDLSNDDFGFNRDSDGYEFAFGGILNPHKDLSIELLAGGLWRSYDDPNLSSIGVPDFGAVIAWKPSSYTNVDFSLDRRARETTLNGASGYVSTAANVGLNHYLAQNLTVGARVSYTQNDYEGVERTDDLIGFDVNNRYYFTPQIYGGVGYQFTHRDSDLAGQDFFDNRIMLRVGAHMNSFNPPLGLTSGLGNNGSFFGGIQTGHGSTYSALDGPRGGGTVTADFGDHGGVTGIFAGYDHFFKKWFMGIEADVEKSSDFDWEHIESGGRIFDVSRKESYGLSLRTGYRQLNNVAYYGRAGVVSTKFDTDYENAGTVVNSNDTKFGFRFGGGIEAPVVGQSGFIRMDYSYAVYEDYGVMLPSGTDTFDNSESIMRIGYVMRTGIDNPHIKFDHHFNGLYAGTQIGYGGFAARNRGPRNAGATLTVDRASHGGTGGVFGGYGIFPFEDNDIYIGLEGDAELSYVDWNIDRDPTGRIYDAQKDWTVGAALRAGYVFNNSLLLYSRFGGVLSKIDTDYVRGATTVNQSDTLAGIRYGVGMEVAATEKVFLRMDYSYTDYESYSVDYSTGVDTFNPTETMVRFGIGYRF